MRKQHPMWNSPARRLALFPLLDDYASLTSAEWEGREAEWAASLVRLAVLYSYVVAHTRRMLDVSAGDGLYTAQLAWSNAHTESSHFTVVAGARSQEECEQVVARVEGVGGEGFVEDVRVVNPADMIGLADASFDLVYVFGPLYEIQEEEAWERVVQEVHRVLKSSGHLIASLKTRRAAVVRAVLDPHGWQTSDDLNHLTLFADPDRYGPIGVPPGLPPHRYMLTEEIPQVFEDQGFVTDEVYPVDVLTSWIPASIWRKVIDAESSAVNILRTLEDILEDDPTLAGLATEVLYVGTKGVNG